MALLVPLVRPVRGVAIAADDLLPVRCRMAQAALRWSVDQLAATAGVDRKTILRFEQGTTTPRAANLAGIRRALEGEGVKFANGAGVFAPN